MKKVSIMTEIFYPLYYFRKIQGILISIELLMCHVNELPDAKKELKVLDELAKSLTKKMDKLENDSKK